MKEYGRIAHEYDTYFMVIDNATGNITKIEHTFDGLIDYYMNRKEPTNRKRYYGNIGHISTLLKIL